MNDLRPMQDVDEQIANLKANVARLLIERDEARSELQRHIDANERLARAVAEATAERDEARRQLRLKSGLGAHENLPNDIPGYAHRSAK